MNKLYDEKMKLAKQKEMEAMKCLDVAKQEAIYLETAIDSYKLKLRLIQENITKLLNTHVRILFESKKRSSRLIQYADKLKDEAKHLITKQMEEHDGSNN